MTALMPTTGVSLAGEATRTWTDVELDPITLRVIGSALNSMAKEMAQVLYRMAYSSLIRESEDLGAGIFDVNGRELCESDPTPMHCGSIPAYIRRINRRLAGTYQPGDVVLLVRARDSMSAMAAMRRHLDHLGDAYEQMDRLSRH